MSHLEDQDFTSKYRWLKKRNSENKIWQIYFYYAVHRKIEVKTQQFSIWHSSEIVVWIENLAYICSDTELTYWFFKVFQISANLVLVSLFVLTHWIYSKENAGLETENGLQ